MISPLQKRKEAGSRSPPKSKLRSSLRLLGDRLRRLGKSAMSLTAKRPGRDPDHSVKEAGPVTSHSVRGPKGKRKRKKRDSLGSYMRWDRKVEAEEFRKYYIYDGSMDNRVYINSNGDTNSWQDNSVGCLWVAVYGKMSMCVAWKGDPELGRYPRTNRMCDVRRLFALNVISEVEDIARSKKHSRQTLDKPVKKPFAVVSLIPSTAVVHQGSGDDVIEASGAVKYLRERMRSGLGFNSTETIQTAISALQHQCEQIFAAEDIWVSELEEGTDTCLPCEEITEHLAEINKPTKPLQTNEIKEHASTIVEAPLQKGEIKSNHFETSEIKELE